MSKLNNETLVESVISYSQTVTAIYRTGQPETMPVYPAASAWPSSVRRLTRLSFILVTILLLAIFASSCRQPQIRKDSAIPLDLTRPLQGNISRGESHTYLISVRQGQYIRLRVDQRQTDTKISLRKPDGQQLIIINGIENVPSIFSLVADDTGDYQLKISSTETGDVSGIYEVKVEEVKLATEIDRKYIASENAFLEGERLRYESKVESSREAIKKYNEAQSGWHAINRKREEAIAWSSQGLIHYQLSEPHPALECYKRALSLTDTSNDHGLRSEILSNIGKIYVHIGKTPMALESCKQALKLSNETGDLRGKARALNGLGEVQYGLGNRWESLKYYREALSIWESLGDRRGRAETLSYLGHLYRDLGEPQKAVEHYDRVLTIYSFINDQRGRARGLTSMALHEAILGSNQKALNLFSEALPILQTVGDRLWEATVILNTGAVYQRLGDLDRALSHFKQAHQIFHDVNETANEAGALSVIGGVHYLKGEYQIALSHFKHVLSVTQAIDDKKFQSNALRKIGAVYSSLGDKKKALIYYKRALSLHIAAGERQGVALSHSEIGKLYRDMNMYGEANKHYQRALELNHVRGDRFAESQTLYSLAMIEREIGQLAKSRSHIETASALVETLRAEVASPNLRATYFASIRQFFEFHIDLLMLQNQRDPSKGLDAEALKVSEGARSRSLLELLTEARTDIRRGADPRLVERERELQKQIEDQAKRKVALIDAKAPITELVMVSKEIDALNAERDRVESQIRSQSPLYASLIKPRPASLEEVQRLLDDNTILLEYTLGNERSYLWVVTRVGLRSYKLPNRPAIEKAAVEVYKLLTMSQSAGQTNKQLEDKYWQKASELSRMILGKVADQLSNKRLLIVADGVLQYIPFQALPDPRIVKSAEMEPLMVNHDIVNLPSASTLAVMRSQTAHRAHPPKTIAVFADPVFQEDDTRLIGKLKSQTEQQAALSSSNVRSSSITTALGGMRVGRDYRRLSWTKDEAEAVIAATDTPDRLVWRGFDANRANAISPELSKYRIIHFATHGDLDTENPELSAIVLSFYNSQGQKQEGYLRLHDIYNLNLPADLIVLSACETALGKEIKGEGLIGLTRGFMYAGASRVMASLWKVEDRSTAELMKHFYKHLLKDKMSSAAALRQAQLAVRNQPQWRLPYHWAGFVLQGEWK